VKSEQESPKHSPVSQASTNVSVRSKRDYVDQTMEKVDKGIKYLAKNHPNGIRLELIMPLYKDIMSEDLNHSLFGYSNILDFVKAQKYIFTLNRTASGDQYVTPVKHFENKEIVLGNYNISSSSIRKTVKQENGSHCVSRIAVVSPHSVSSVSPVAFQASEITPTSTLDRKSFSPSFVPGQTTERKSYSPIFAPGHTPEEVRQRKNSLKMENKPNQLLSSAHNLTFKNEEKNGIFKPTPIKPFRRTNFPFINQQRTTAQDNNAANGLANDTKFSLIKMPTLITETQHSRHNKMDSTIENKMPDVPGKYEKYQEMDIAAAQHEDDGWVQICVSEVKNPHHFYAHIRKNEKALTKLMDNMM
ncbi:unnamed protein product, partial [Meganyctiphanes norvegica]